MATAAVDTPRIGSKYVTRTITFHADQVSCGVDIRVELIVHEDSTGEFTTPEIRLAGGDVEESGNDVAGFAVRSAEALRVLGRMLIEVAAHANRIGMLAD